MNQKVKNVLLFLPILLFGAICGYLIGTGLTTSSVAVDSDAWDEVSMTESEYNNNFVTEAVVDSETSNKPDIDINNIVTGYNRCSNDDKIGWIYYPNICDYPILFSGDTYYLNHTVDKKYSSNGAIFADAAASSFFEDYTLIHGHHLNNGKMFTKLKNLKNSAQFKANRYFCIYSPDTNAVFRYRVIAVTIVNGAKELIPGAFEAGTERDEYIYSLIRRSKFECSYTEDELKNVVILHTCDYTFKNAHLLVLGVKDLEVSVDG